MAKDTETIVGNGMATLLAITAGVLGVLGLLTGFDMIDVERPFETGLLWMATGIIAGLCATVFRREHHILDEDEVRRSEFNAMRRSDTYGDSTRETYRDVSERDVTSRGEKYVGGTARDVGGTTRGAGEKARDVGEDIGKGNINKP
jgi:hypothetical protein